MKIKKRILIVSDRFPPDHEGGAEISLQSTLNELKQSYDINVAVLCNNVSRISCTRETGLTVARLPFPDTWPPQQNIPVGRHLRKPTLVNKLIALLRYFAASSGNRFAKKLSLTYNYFHLSCFGESRLMPRPDIDVVFQGPTSNALARYANKIKPDLIHADNLVSALFVAESCNHLPCSVFVRDNRFFCTQSSGGANIKGVSCVKCEFGCLVDSQFKKALAGVMDDNRTFRQNALRKFDSIVVASLWLKHQLEKITSESQQLYVVPNSRNEKMLKKASSSTAENLLGPPEILFVGSLYPEKGPLILMDIVPQLIEELKSFRVVIVGTGTLEKKIETRINERGFEKLVKLIGFCSSDQLVEYYKRASVIVCPSLVPEGFGRVPLEAAIFEKPCIAFANGGLAENIIDGKTGLLVENSSSKELAAAIVELIRTPEKAKLMGQNAKQFLLGNSKYSPSVNAESIARIWDATINARNPS